MLTKDVILRTERLAKCLVFRNEPLCDCRGTVEQNWKEIESYWISFSMLEDDPYARKRRMGPPPAPIRCEHANLHECLTCGGDLSMNGYVVVIETFDVRRLTKKLWIEQAFCGLACLTGEFGEHLAEELAKDADERKEREKK